MRQQSVAITPSPSSDAHAGRGMPASTSRSAAAHAALPDGPSATEPIARSIASASALARASNSGMNPPTSASSKASPAISPKDTNTAPAISASSGSSERMMSAPLSIKSLIICCGSKASPEQAGQSHSSCGPDTSTRTGRRVEFLVFLPFRPRLTGLIRQVCPIHPYHVVTPHRCTRCRGKTRPRRMHKPASRRSSATPSCSRGRCTAQRCSTTCWYPPAFRRHLAGCHPSRARLPLGTGGVAPHRHPRRNRGGRRCSRLTPAPY